MLAKRDYRVLTSVTSRSRLDRSAVSRLYWIASRPIQSLFVSPNTRRTLGLVHVRRLRDDATQADRCHWQQHDLGRRLDHRRVGRFQLAASCYPNNVSRETHLANSGCSCGRTTLDGMLGSCLSSESPSKFPVYGIDRHSRLVSPIGRAWPSALTARVPALRCDRHGGCDFSPGCDQVVNVRARPDGNPLRREWLIRRWAT